MELQAHVLEGPQRYLTGDVSKMLLREKQSKNFPLLNSG